MLVFIALTAALGAVLVKYIDNWGHGGGLLVGVALGLAHRWLRARVGRPTAWGAGVLTLLAIAGSAAAQYASERREGPARLERKLVRRSNYLARASTELAWLRRPEPPRVHLFAGYDLRLMSWGDGSAVPTSGRNLVIVGTDNNGLLHIRIFDASGNAVTNTDETKRPATHAGAISALKQRLPGLLPPHVLTGAEKAQLASEATSIVDPTLLVASKWLDYLDEELDRRGRAEVAALRPMIADAMEDPPDEERRRAIDEHLTRLLALMQQQYDDDRRRLRELRGHPRPPEPGKDRMAN
jgi:hypothetical protein